MLFIKRYMKIIGLNNFFFIVLLISFSKIGSAQLILDTSKVKFNFYEKSKPYILPTAFVVYGFIALKNEKLLNLNVSIKNKLSISNAPKSSSEEFFQYAPALSYYVLNFSNVKSKNSIQNGTIKLASAAAMMSVVVYSIKFLTKIERPDKSAFTSFPSGHTATAFMTAEFLRSEYKATSKWIGIGAYTFATATAIYRIKNNRHWLNDVIAGAGFGILSAKAGEKIQPFISKKLNIIFKTKTFAIIPTWQNKQIGIALVSQF